jgi:nitrate/nitrite-specific signal transduction histidine kinase
MMLLRIEQDIKNVQAAIADVNSRIDTIHLEYAQAIAKAIQKQILLTVFKFCTQKCPDGFLALSLAERQKLQAALQKTIKVLCEQMQKTLEECDRESRTNQENLDLLLSKLLNDSIETLNQILIKHKILGGQPLEDKAPQMSIRLAEIEFTDRNLMSYRGELRVLSARLAHLSNELEKKYQQKLIAEAEIAWQSAWVEA